MIADPLETELRKALRRKQPSRDLMPVVPASGKWRMAVAAATILVCLFPFGWQSYRLRQQRLAGEKLLTALQLTAEKLQQTQTQLQTFSRRHSQ